MSEDTDMITGRLGVRVQVDTDQGVSGLIRLSKRSDFDFEDPACQ